MNISASLAAGVAVTLAVSGAATAQTGATGTDALGAQDFKRGSSGYVVVLDQDARVSTALSSARQSFGTSSVEHVYESAIKGYSAELTRAEAKALARSPGVHSVHRDRRFAVTAQAVPTGIRRTRAAANRRAQRRTRTQRVDVDVAVIDTGVDLNHPDLNVYRRGAKNCSYTSVTANDGHGHGTHVAGTIGALDNRIGVVGVAPGARIWPVRVFGPSGAGSLSEVICGVDYVTRHAGRIDVVNMSLSSAGGTDDGACGRKSGDPLHRAICRSVAAGVTYVVAAGNSSQNAALSTPAAYDEVITVSAMADFDGRPGGRARATCRPDTDDTFADFSNYGGDVDLTAPGVCIRSTWRRDGYGTISGTSMATPHVAGGAALFLASHRRATPARVRSALVTAGTSRWRAHDDPDGRQEPLLDVTGF